MQILKWFNGANDVETVAVPRERVDFSKNWTFEALRLFHNGAVRSKLVRHGQCRLFSETRNRVGHGGLPAKIDFAKSLVESCVSRAMIEFMVHALNLTGILRQIETNRYGIDEIILPTLNSNDAINAPGGFTQDCLRRHKDVPYVSRYFDFRNEHQTLLKVHGMVLAGQRVSQQALASLHLRIRPGGPCPESCEQHATLCE